eukprot:COSAG02_NODE_8062_length_2727_cov_1.852740_2_plen_540_part_00
MTVCRTAMSRRALQAAASLLLIAVLGQLVVLSAGAASVATLPARTSQTAAQRESMARLRAQAVPASSAATQSLLHELASPAFASNLSTLAPALAALSPTQLLARWQASVEVAEVAHGFHAQNDPMQNNALDLDIDIASSADTFYNQWQLPVLFPQRESAAYYELMSFLGPAAAMEVELYKLPPFSASIPGRTIGRPALWPGGWPANLSEASDRMVYAILNQHQVDFPTWLWGDVAVVFNNSAVQDMLLYTPMDSGDYVCDCTDYSRHFCAAWSNQSACSHFWYCRWDSSASTCGAARTQPKPSCAVWTGVTPGVAGALNHLMLPFARWAGETPDAQPTVDYARIARLFARQLQPWGMPGYPNMTIRAFDYYFEAQLLGNPQYDGGIKMIIADFEVNFGTRNGDKIRNWCAKRGWPLVWSSSTLSRPESPMDPVNSHGQWQAQGRVLDAVVTTSRVFHNLSSEVDRAKPAHAATWAKVKTARADNATGVAKFLGWWKQLVDQTPEALRPAPLMPGDCARPHDCIGVTLTATATRDCVCYS